MFWPIFNSGNEELVVVAERHGLNVPFIDLVLAVICSSLGSYVLRDKPLSVDARPSRELDLTFVFELEGFNVEEMDLEMVLSGKTCFNVPYFDTDCD